MLYLIRLIERDLQLQPANADSLVEVSLRLHWDSSGFVEQLITGMTRDVTRDAKSVLFAFDEFSELWKWLMADWPRRAEIEAERLARIQAEVVEIEAAMERAK